MAARHRIRTVHPRDRVPSTGRLPAPAGTRTVGTNVGPGVSPLGSAVHAGGARLRRTDCGVHLEQEPVPDRLTLRRPDRRTHRTADDHAVPDHRSDDPPRPRLPHCQRPGLAASPTCSPRPTGWRTGSAPGGAEDPATCIDAGSSVDSGSVREEHTFDGEHLGAATVDRNLQPLVHPGRALDGDSREIVCRRVDAVKGQPG